MDAQNKLLKYAQADPEGAAKLLLQLKDKVIVPHETQKIILEDQHRFQVVCCGRRYGKSLSTASDVLTPSGWTTVGELEVGDYVVGSDGKPTLVEGVFPQGELASFRVYFNDKSWVDCSEDHLWTVRSRNPAERPWKTLTLREIMDRGLAVEKGKGRKFRIPGVKPIEFEEKDLPINPYLLGAILGDGGISQGSIILSSADQEILNQARTHLEPEGELNKIKNSNYDYRFKKTPKLRQALVDLELKGKRSYEKHIPKKYMYASIKQREELLQGLMDTDGWAETPNQVALSSSSKQLRNDVRELMRGLGGRPISWKKKTTHRDAYLVQGSLPVGIQPFKLKRKLERYKPTPLTFDRSIISIEPRGNADMTCIQVSNPDGLFVTKDYIVTHNTVIGAKKCLLKARQPNQTIWWCAPTYKVVRRGYAEILRQLPPGLLSKAAPSETSFDAGRSVKLHFKNGSVIELYSAERPESMLGEGVDYVVLDEAATMSKAVWETIIRPTLMDSQGEALMISTPRQRNWFYYFWMRGQSNDPRDADVASWKFPTSANPYIKQSEIEELEHSLPMLIFEQEVLAEFISAAGSVFRFSDKQVVEPVKPKGHVVIGVDLAKSNDFTVFSAARADDMMPCGFDRMREVSWPMQRNRLKSFAMRLLREGATHVTLVMDSTGVGDPITEDMEVAGFDVVPINFKKWKQQMVIQLSKDLEDGIVRVSTEEELHEYENYTYKVTDAGNWTYSAPEGQHDDIVSAKMLQHWGVTKEGAPNATAISGGDEINPRDAGEDEFPDEDFYADEENDTGVATVETFAQDDMKAIMGRRDAWTGIDY